MDTDKRLAIVTTGAKIHASATELARQTAERLELSFVQRRNRSLDELRQEYQVQNVLVAKKGALTLVTPAGELFFHSSMAHLRIKNLRMGKTDHMLSAMGLAAGMRVLDCTLGFGADAIVASFAVGAQGKVVGVESNPLIAAVIGYGMGHVTAENYDIHEAMRRIEVQAADYADYLSLQADKSFDVVYFDPMFRHPIQASMNMDPLRVVADHRPVTSAAIQQAVRVARKRVVFKENSRSMEFARLGFSTVVGGKYSSVHYGILEL